MFDTCRVASIMWYTVKADWTLLWRSRQCSAAGSVCKLCVSCKDVKTSFQISVSSVKLSGKFPHSGINKGLFYFILDFHDFNEMYKNW